MNIDTAKQKIREYGFFTTDSSTSRNAIRYLDGEVSAGRLQKLPAASPESYAYVTKQYAKKVTK